MTPIIVHFLIFLFITAVSGCLMSKITQWLARSWKLEFDPPSRLRIIKSILWIAGAGALGQLLFSGLTTLGLSVLLARLVAWLGAALISGLSLRQMTPFMPLKRTIVVSLCSGLIGWAGFYWALPFGELIAQLAGISALFATWPLAILFPLPEEQRNEQSLCPCGIARSRCKKGAHSSNPAPNSTSTTPITQETAQGMTIQIGRLPAPGRISTQVPPPRWRKGT